MQNHMVQRRACFAVLLSAVQPPHGVCTAEGRLDTDRVLRKMGDSERYPLPMKYGSYALEAVVSAAYCSCPAHSTLGLSDLQHGS